MMIPDGFNNVFYGYMAAEQQGFRSRSQWKKRGRIVSDDAVPSFVVRKVARSEGRPVNPVIEELEADYFCLLMMVIVSFPSIKRLLNLFLHVFLLILLLMNLLHLLLPPPPLRC